MVWWLTVGREGPLQCEGRGPHTVRLHRVVGNALYRGPHCMDPPPPPINRQILVKTITFVSLRMQSVGKYE